MKTEYFDSVWDAIEPSKTAAANMKARAELMIAIQETAKGWHTTLAASVKRLGLTQPRLNDLLRGRINKFSLDALMNHAFQSGLSIKLKIVRPAE